MFIRIEDIFVASNIITTYKTKHLLNFHM